MSKQAIEMRGITKRFPGVFHNVIANDNIHFKVKQGAIHFIVGENGAGKSTLMNILYGLIQPDSGEISVFGKNAHIHSPKVAIDLGIGMIHQHFMLVPSFSIGENIILGNEPNIGSLLDRKRIDQIVTELASSLKMPIDPNTKIYDTSVGIQQRVEILKALYQGAKILILDEPTAILTPQEVDELFISLNRLRDSGTTIIMITHKLPEVMKIAENVTVMRDGQIVGEYTRKDISESILAKLMTGRQVSQKNLPRSRYKGSKILEVLNLQCQDNRGILTVKGVNLTLNQGEILGIAGVAHNGQEELAEAITGQRDITEGKIIFAEQDITNNSVKQIREFGMGHIPDDRYDEGCAKKASLSKNLIMGSHDKKPIGNKYYISNKEVKKWSKNIIKEYEIKADYEGAPIISLSGGNVQKAIVAREIHQATKCLIAEQPSRGIDIGAAESIYQKLKQFRDKGGAILLISMDLTEIMRLSDRIYVIFDGKIVGETNPKSTNQAELGLLMAGIFNATKEAIKNG
jgi:general nucleoside transport system ATP-binding protein